MSKIDFSKLKANRSNMASNLRTQIEGINKGGFKEDERIWKPKTDKSGQGYHVVRFLPNQYNEKLLFAHLIKYNVYGRSGTYWENSMATFDHELTEGKHPDPAREEKDRLFQLDTKASKEAGKKIKRQEEFYANIYVKSDSENPENNGKVFLFKYGKQIHNIISKAMNPEKKFGNTEKKNVFDMFKEGYDFEIKISSKEIPDRKDPSKNVLVPDYSESEVGKQCPALEDEAEMAKIFEQTHDVGEFIERDKFKPYDELSKKFNRVMGIDGTVGSGDKTAGDLLNESEEPEPTQDSTFDEDADEAALKQIETAEPTEEKTEEEKPTSTTSTDAEDFFQNLANNS